MSASLIRAFSSGSGGEAVSAVQDGDADDDDYLQAYEDLLLNAVSGGGEDGFGDAAGSGGDSPAVHPAVDGEMNAGLFDFTAEADAARSPVDVLVDDALALLPDDGAPVLLTDLGRSLDTETVCDLFGSVRAFVQLYPNRFACAQDPATGRWRVSRTRHAPGTAAAAEAKAAAEAARDAAATATMAGLDVTAMALEEDLRNVHGPHSTLGAPQRHGGGQSGGSEGTATPPRRPPTRRRLMPAAAPGAPTASHAWWPVIADHLPANGSPVAIAALRASLPAHIAEALHDGGVGLARCFKRDFDVARRSVALTADASALLRVERAATESEGTVASTGVPLWYPGRSTFVSVTSATPQERTELAVAEFSAEASELGDGAYVMAPPDYDASDDAKPWLVSLQLDEAGGGGEAGEPHPAAAAEVTEEEDGDFEAAAAALASATGMEEVAYDGLDAGEGDAARRPGAILTVSDLNLDRLRTAPVVPVSKARMAMDGPGSAAAVRPPRPSTPAEWLALHTAMAEARGWLTPMQMLDYLVECVPMFFIPVDELRASDALLKLIGPRTSMRTLVCRVYMYYVECDADKTQVRLAASVTHEQRGAANEHYAAWDPEKVEAASHDADGAATPCGAATLAKRPGRGSTLKATAATRAFPVLKVQRPIKSRLPVRAFKRKRPPPAATTTAVGAPAETEGAAPAPGEAAAAPPSSAALMHFITAKARPSPATTLLQRSSRASIALDSVSPSEIGYPFLALATQPVAAWPWWAQLVCVLPFDAYVPLDQIGVFYCPGLGDSERHRVWCAGDATPPTSAKDSPTPIPLSMLRSPSATQPRAVRLRPFWLAPGCTAELENALLPAALVRQLRPTWVPVPRVLARLTAEDREACTAAALRRPQAARLTAEAAVAALLRDGGRGCWVDGEGARVRRYAAASDLDDNFHLALSLLYGFSSARTWEPLTAVLDRAAAHVRPLLDHPRAPPPATPDAVGLLGMLRHAPPAELHAYLKRHVQWIEVKVEGDVKEVGEPQLRQLLLRRRAALVSF